MMNKTENTSLCTEKQREIIKRAVRGQSADKTFRKLLHFHENPFFQKIIKYSLNYCMQCNLCAERCAIYEATDRDYHYAPMYKGILLREILLTNDSSPEQLINLYELAYSCTVCRRCDQACPMGVSNALITREIRKVFSQEYGVSPAELHEEGSMKQLNTGAATGMTSSGLKAHLEFCREELAEYTDLPVQIPIDDPNAEYIFVPNAGDFVSWPENLIATAILLHIFNVSWTLSSEIIGYDGVNYGSFYDDLQLFRISSLHEKAFAGKKILIGECGHEHKTQLVLTDPYVSYARESIITLIARELPKVWSKQFNLFRNKYPVTYHDSCNFARMLGMVEPQRNIIHRVASQFIEMTPNKADNYCCGGGSGLSVIHSAGKKEWCRNVSGKKKMEQINHVFRYVPRETPKYIVTNCANCKAQFRNLLEGNTDNLHYIGMAEFVCNAFVGLRKSFIGE